MRLRAKVNLNRSVDDPVEMAEQSGFSQNTRRRVVEFELDRFMSFPSGSRQRAMGEQSAIPHSPTLWICLGFASDY